MAFAILLESGDQLLLESGDVALTEEDAPPSYVLVDQGGTYPMALSPHSHRSMTNRHMRHYTPGNRGTNVFILTDNTITTRQPRDAATISRVVHGGHDVPTDLTSAEITLLLNAGYIEVE